MKVKILEIASTDLIRINEILDRESVDPDQIISITYSRASSIYKIFYKEPKSE
jgi:hypothetical protein